MQTTNLASEYARTLPAVVLPASARDFRRSPRPARPPSLHACRLAPAERREAPASSPILSLLPLVHRVALGVRRRLPAYAPLQTEDLVSAGVLGLIDALKKYDPRRQTPVEHYALFRIRGAILDSLREWDGAPRPLRRLSKAVARVTRELESELGRPPEGAELARALGMTLDRWHASRRELRDTTLPSRPSRPAWGADKSESPRSSFEPVEAESPYDACARRERSDLVARAVLRLPDRERQVILSYYRDELTQKQIGIRLCLSEARVCQLRSAALLRLRKTLVREVRSPRYIL